MFSKASFTISFRLKPSSNKKYFAESYMFPFYLGADKSLAISHCCLGDLVGRITF